jgi:hypothetical protein
MTNYQEERMKQLIGGLPQNRGMDWDAVTPVIDFQFSKQSDPVRARRENIRRAKKTLKPVKRWTGVFGYKFNSRPQQCVVTGVDCTYQDYGDLRQEFLIDPVTKQRIHFTPWTGVLPGKGRQMTGTYCPQALQLYKLLMEWMEQEERENERGFFRQMQKKGVSFIPIKKPPAKPKTPLEAKYEEAVAEAIKDGIPVTRLVDSFGRNRGTQITFYDDYIKGMATDGTPFGHADTLAEFYALEQSQEKMFDEAFSTAMKEAYQ